jgi:hypothetical protein
MANFLYITRPIFGLVPRQPISLWRPGITIENDVYRDIETEIVPDVIAVEMKEMKDGQD